MGNIDVLSAKDSFEVVNFNKVAIDSGIGTSTPSPNNEFNSTHHLPTNFRSPYEVVNTLSHQLSDYVFSYPIDTGDNSNSPYTVGGRSINNLFDQQVVSVELSSVMNKFQILDGLDKGKTISLILFQHTLNLLVPYINSNKFLNRGIVINNFQKSFNLDNDLVNDTSSYLNANVVQLKSNTYQQVYDNLVIAFLLAKRFKLNVIHTIDSDLYSVQTNKVQYLNTTDSLKLFATDFSSNVNLGGNDVINLVFNFYSSFVGRKIQPFTYNIATNGSRILVISDLELDVKEYNSLKLTNLNYRPHTSYLAAYFQDVDKVIVVERKGNSSVYFKLLATLLHLNVKPKLERLTPTDLVAFDNIKVVDSSLEHQSTPSIISLTYSSSTKPFNFNSLIQGLDSNNQFVFKEKGIDVFTKKPIHKVQLYSDKLLNTLFVNDVKLLNVKLDLDKVKVIVIDTNTKLILPKHIVDCSHLKIYHIDTNAVLDKFKELDDSALTLSLILALHVHLQQPLLNGSYQHLDSVIEFIVANLQFVDTNDKFVKVIESKAIDLTLLPYDLKVNSFQQELNQLDQLKLQLLFKSNLSSKVERRPEHSNSYLIKVSKKLRLTPLNYDRNIFHIEFDIADSNLKYEVGDALGIYGNNDTKLVDQLLIQLKLDGSRLLKLDIGSKVQYRTLYQLLVQKLDVFGRPSKDFYQYLLNNVKDLDHLKRLEFLLSKNGTAQLKKKVDGFTNYVDLLTEFDSIELKTDQQLQKLVDNITDIKPRHYSIASAQSLHPNSVHLLIVTVSWLNFNNEIKQGQCTNYLNNVKIGDEILVSVKPSVMKLPEDPKLPIVMAGLGTGMAPFKAFLEEKIVQRSKGIQVGPIVLYFGARTRKEEYLYGDIWDKYLAEGLITNLGLAFSRDQKHKIYIQHRIQQDELMIKNWLLDTKGVFYLCGPTWPELDVRLAIANSFKPQFEDSLDKALEYVEKLKDEEKYILELY